MSSSIKILSFSESFQICQRLVENIDRIMEQDCLCQEELEVLKVFEDGDGSAEGKDCSNVDIDDPQEDQIPCSGIMQQSLSSDALFVCETSKMPVSVDVLLQPSSSKESIHNSSVVLDMSSELKEKSQERDSEQHSELPLSNEAIEKNLAASDDMNNVQEESKAHESALPQYHFESFPNLITGAWDEFSPPCGGCFTKGCKWSPDGTCILTNSDDNVLRIFDLPRELHCQETWPEGQRLPQLKPSLTLKESGSIYDYCWYPFMSSWNPMSCCLIATCQNNPIHLWDAYSGELRCSYRAYNNVDEVEHAFSVAFSVSGEKLYSGFKNNVRVFDTSVPGRECYTHSFKGLDRPVGIVSAVCVNPVNQNVFAACGFMRTIVLCAEPEGNVLCFLCNEGGGLTHMMFSPDGTRLYAGSRCDSQLFCWDMRNLGNVLFTTERTVKTHQRIYFDVSPDGRFLVSGGTDGIVSVWDTQMAPTPSSTSPFLPTCSTFQAHPDCVNGISLHKQYPILATSSGQRHVYCKDEDSDEEERDPVPRKKLKTNEENSLKLWWMGPSSQVQADQDR